MLVNISGVFVVEVVLVDKRGQMVVPLKLRKELGIEKGGALAMDVSAGKMVAKKLNTPSRNELLMEWNELTKILNKKVTALGIKEEDVGRIIHKARGIKI